MECVVVTPESTVLETTATFVVLPLFDGEIGIAPRHSPMVGRLGFGEMRVVQQNETQRYYVDGGFVQVVDNRVTVLTPRAIPAANVDAEVAVEQLATLRAQQAHGDPQIDQRDRQIKQARAQLHVARRGE
jgi:F-type H+-transporting ATPase subunit epsilon